MAWRTGLPLQTWTWARLLRKLSELHTLMCLWDPHWCWTLADVIPSLSCRLLWQRGWVLIDEGREDKNLSCPDKVTTYLPGNSLVFACYLWGRILILKKYVRMTRFTHFPTIYYGQRFLRYPPLKWARGERESLKGFPGLVTSPREREWSRRPGLGKEIPRVDNYKKTISVKKGMIVQIEFTGKLVISKGCFRDRLSVVDKDGTVLWDKRCNSDLPPTITSSTNTIHISFTGIQQGSHNPFDHRWKAKWKSLDPGVCVYTRVCVRWGNKHYRRTDKF